MITLIIGGGANNIEIPLMVFESPTAARKHLAEIGLTPDEENSNFYSLDENALKKQKHVENPLVNALFLNGCYYSGCGGCSMLELREVEFGQPIVGWDLD
jgi:hypothetical protein